MEILAIVLVILTAIGVSVIGGILIGTNRMRKAIEEGSVGHLRIDRSEVDEAPKAFLEIVGTTLTSSIMGHMF